MDVLQQAYGELRTSVDLKAYIESDYFGSRMFWTAAKAIVSDFQQDPQRWKAVLNGKVLVPRTVELHATRGTCSFKCQMCLWSDRAASTYRSRGLNIGQTLSREEWIAVLNELAAEGCREIVFSGGGEPLLNTDLADLLKHCRDLGLRTSLYTTGYDLHRLSSSALAEICRMNQVRFSIHGSTSGTYDEIAGTPGTWDALTTVVEQVKMVRNAKSAETRVGIGFVAQSANLHCIESMADLATQLDVDFLAIRQDEVEISRSLSNEEAEAFAEQLRTVRQRKIDGCYPDGIDVNFSDDLVRRANGESRSIRSGGECYVKHFRPAINPYGSYSACDLKAEPLFSDSDYDFGNVRADSMSSLFARAAENQVSDSCSQCMPSSRTINSIVSKLVSDEHAGLPLRLQPFAS